ncbi:MAG: lipid-A-disaccharide synthase [Pseudomonadota bacterium]
MNPSKIYIIAGEASGDFLGANAMKALKAQHPNAEFFGIGGALMMEQGLKPLFPMEELSLMGVFEIAPKLFSILKRIRQTVDHIEEVKPDILLTIDAPDFSFRVQKAIRKRSKIKPKQLHYVAPTVWAWRPKRAQKISQFLDGLICLFDFEPPYFEKYGLKSIAAGHPMMEEYEQIIKLPDEKKSASETKKLCVLFGSRHGEIKRVGPTLVEALKVVIQKHDSIELYIPTLPKLEEEVRALTEVFSTPVHISTDPNKKWDVFSNCDAAMAVSGTVALELSVANLPHVIAYKMSPLTWVFLKRILTTKYAHLGNIILDKPSIPEFIQENCDPGKIARETLTLLDDELARQSQRESFEDIRQNLGEGFKPSQRAAEFISFFL